MRNIEVAGARQNNLQNIDVCVPGEGLTVVTGVSGSGKSSLVFDTIYHEAHRRFLEIFSLGSSVKLVPASVETISGLGPAIAVGQNLLNRNPLSTLATASGLHPFLRLLYSNFGNRYCPQCGTGLALLTEDEIVEIVLRRARDSPITVIAPLVHNVHGSHTTLIQLLTHEFGDHVTVDGHPWTKKSLNPQDPHSIEIEVASLSGEVTATRARETVKKAFALGSTAVIIRSLEKEEILSRASVCVKCGYWFHSVKPKHFHTVCPYCQGEGCTSCLDTGLHPQAAAVTWKGFRLPDMLGLSVDEARTVFDGDDFPDSAYRLYTEIVTRLTALQTVGLGYITLDRSSPTMSRGEAQRVRLAVALTSRLEDMLHILDEPTIGQHPYDVQNLVPAFRELAGPVIFVEHDRMAAAIADYAVDLGPGAGIRGGKIVFAGIPQELWKAETPTGQYFSFRKKVALPRRRTKPLKFLVVRKAHLRNLKDIDVPIPLSRLTVVTGVSGSGKSTFIDVLEPSLRGKNPRGCERVEGPSLTPVVVDQSPIGRNPRSNPATYTKLSDIVRGLYSRATRLSPSHFSFNRPEGMCPVCKGMGAVEVKMRYLPSTWITCERCEGNRFSEEVVGKKIDFGDKSLSIADFYELTIDEALPLLNHRTLPASERVQAKRILEALRDVGLGYLSLGQPSPTLSGGEAQRVKLARYLGSRSLSRKLLILDEPSTGLHPKDISGLLTVLDRLVRAGGTVVVIEHNTDIMRAADWIIDLGPRAGPAGGELLFAGQPDDLLSEERSLTAKVLLAESEPPAPSVRPVPEASKDITVTGACAHNLKSISVTIPKGVLTVITGVSGSGKSSLVTDVLEAEARRRFLESLSMYERQSVKEGPEAPVESVMGLGVAVSVKAGSRGFNRRATVGSDTEILHHLTVLISTVGKRACLECGSSMDRGQTWECPTCGATAALEKSSAFLFSNWLSACPTCQGVGTLQKPNPEKLIVNPGAPLCKGAMYSPGFFPKGFLCKPFNSGYYMVQALAERYDFDPQVTPWNEMSKRAQDAFLFGDPEPLTVSSVNRKGQISVREHKFPGFFGWIRDWDVGGTYTEAVVCPQCNGGRLRPEFLAVTLQGYNIHELAELPLATLADVLSSIVLPPASRAVTSSLEACLRRLTFLLQVGLGYLHLNRVSATLSAGEAERVTLAGVLGSKLTSLTVLLDEPSRGLHPSEVSALVSALKELRDERNTVIVVEHDPMIIREADHVIDMGPGAGIRGGHIVAEGSVLDIGQTDTVTGAWLRGERSIHVRERRSPRKWMHIRGARQHNLKDIDVDIPLGVLVGICGVSGSGKSTLVVDILGRALSPRKQTTSVAHEPIAPGAHDKIEGAPERVVLVDQTRKGIYSPAGFLGLNEILQNVYAHSEGAKALGLGVEHFKKRCSVCNGRGTLRMDMGFLPCVYSPCDACNGTGYSPEAWDVRIEGLTLPELCNLTIDEVYSLFEDDERIVRILRAVKQVGLGYLALHQPGYSLSGGEAQRLKIAKELCGKTPQGSLYILDEPTVGQHMEDVGRLIDVLQQLVDAGHTVLVIEHNPYVLASCDWLIELGPGGGPEGGTVVGEAPPEDFCQKGTITGRYVREVLEGTT
ncbi:MAG: ATP-binding cassette domain-containing protein [Theionarchaea archaeon]|nr:ATP-binding cassette domain-containing protein [Theionarchaea archaeon]